MADDKRGSDQPRTYIVEIDRKPGKLPPDEHGVRPPVRPVAPNVAKPSGKPQSGPKSPKKG